MARLTIALGAKVTKKRKRRLPFFFLVSALGLRPKHSLILILILILILTLYASLTT